MPVQNISPDHPDVDEALDHMNLTLAQRLGVEAVAGLKADLYYRGEPNGLEIARRYDILYCLLGIDPEDPESKEALAAGVSPERVAKVLADERTRLLQQAETLGSAMLDLLKRKSLIRDDLDLS